MSTTKIKFSPSINIVRDSKYQFNYISTPNAKQAFSQLLNDALVGVKSHVIIGAYGTGKSSMLLAFKQTLEGTAVHFRGYEKLLKQIPKYEFLSIIGEYTSILDYFAKVFQVDKKDYASADVIKAIEKKYKQLQKAQKGLAIIIDEFGKFLEYASKHSPESELYFIQQLSEWVNDSSNDTLLITTLHQDFNAYSLNLSKSQRQEWDKVKGRLKDVPFNEPVEQLLYLASQRLDQRYKKGIFDKNFDKLFECIKEAKAFPLRDYFEKDFAQKLFPFDILSLSILTLSLQKYGQNERSLFSFIESNDQYGISDFSSKESCYYSIANVYDYLMNSHYSFLTTKYNPHYVQWASIRRALERKEGVLNAAMQMQAGAILKTIGLLNIFATATAKLEPRFYINYAKYALGIKNPEEVIKELEKHKIIRYVNHSFKYILFEGTDLDIELAIDDAGRLVEKVSSVVNYLNQYFEFPFISAKSVYYKKGTPRFFQFKLSEEPIVSTPEGEVDGFINLVFSDNEKIIKKIEETSKIGEEAILYGYYRNTTEIKNLLFEIQKVKKVKEVNINDKIAIRELDAILDHYIKLLNHYVLDNLYSANGTISWYYQGKKQIIPNRQKFNQVLSRICDDVYHAVPIYRNELINKTKISAQIALARKRLIEKLLSDVANENIGFVEAEFPPEKSIYLSLIKETGIHSKKENGWLLDIPTDKSFASLWQTSIDFLNSTKTKEKSLSDFIYLLVSKPYKLKQGFLDFWIPLFLLTKTDEYALYENRNGQQSYLPELTADVLELINKKPGSFNIKAFDVAGIKLQLFNRYRVLLNQAEHSKPTNKLFIQTIRPFLTFYRDLPDYAKNTKRLDKRTLALRHVIANSKDPEKTFFDDFPTALGYNLNELQAKPKQAETFIRNLQEAIKELRISYEALLDRFETYFLSEILGTKLSFPDYKDSIKIRFKNVKVHLLLSHQKTFYNRLHSALDDRKSWLSSLAQGCVGKPLNLFSDEDEVMLFDKIKDLVYELDNLSEISRDDVDDEIEEVLKLEITSFVQGLNKNLLRIPKSKSQEMENKSSQIRLLLGKDRKMNLAVLTKLLQELLSHE